MNRDELIALAKRLEWAAKSSLDCAVMAEAAATLRQMAEQQPVGVVSGTTSTGALIITLNVPPGGRSPQLGAKLYAYPIATA